MPDNAICVIIPFSGRTTYLKTALASCIQQTLAPEQVIVANDSSNNKNFRRLQEFLEPFKDLIPGLEAVQSTRISGAGATRNAGLLSSKARFVAFLDDDDTFLPWKLAEQSKLMQDTGAVMSHTNYLRNNYATHQLLEVDTGRHQGGYESLQKLVHRECWIATPTVMLDMRAIDTSLPLFPEDKLLGEDTLAWIETLARSQGSLAHLEIASTVVRTHPNSIQGSLKPDENTIHRADLRRTIKEKSLLYRIKPVRFDGVRQGLLKCSILLFNLSGKPSALAKMHSQIIRWL